MNFFGFFPMKNLLATTAISVAMCTPLFAQSNDDLIDLIEGGISAINEEGAGLTIGAREKGDDGSLVLRDIVLKPEDEDITISAGFLSVKPTSGEPGEILITVSDQVSVLVEPEGEVPLEIVLNYLNALRTSRMSLVSLNEVHQQLCSHLLT